jgi:hypothetical protein
MLGNDVELFYKLLDSLSNSLRDLIVKYELLVSTTNRQSSCLEKTDGAISEIAVEVSTSFLQISKELDLLKRLASENKDKNSEFVVLIQSMSTLLDSIDEKMEDVLKFSISVENCSNENKSVSLHIDSHMDTFGNQLTAMQSAFQDITKMRLAVEEMKAQFEPFKKLAVLLSKPAAIIVGIYIVVTTLMAIFTAIEKYNEFTPQDNVHRTTSSTQLKNENRR